MRHAHRPFRPVLALGSATVAVAIAGGSVLLGSLTSVYAAAPLLPAASTSFAATLPHSASLLGSASSRAALTARSSVRLHAATSSTRDSGLEAAIRRRLSHATAGRVAAVVDIVGRGRVASINASTSNRPASTQKLFTTLPLLLHQPWKRLVTTVHATHAPSGGVLHGDLVVTATADPSLMVGDLTDLARQVRNHGVRRVTGRLLLDVGGFSLRTRRDGWKSSFVPDDVGPLSPFAVHEDQLDHSSWYLQYPTLGNLIRMRAQLKNAGVSIAGGNVVMRHAKAPVALASHTSHTINALVAHALTLSDNFYAEQLLAIGGGLAPVQQTAKDAGVTGTSTEADGSGLSDRDWQTAGGEVALLDYAQKSAAYTRLHNGLAVACRTGTLKHRMCGTIASGRVFAKTGTLAHTKALSGFTTDAKGRLVVFAILCDNVSDTGAASNAEDSIAVLLRSYQG